MIDIIRWIFFFIIWGILSVGTMIISQSYFEWLLPLKEIKDWIVFIVLFVPSIFILMSQYFAVIVASLILIYRQRENAYALVILIAIFTFIYSFFFMPGKYTFQTKINTIQSIFLIIMLGYLLIFKNNEQQD